MKSLAPTLLAMSVFLASPAFANPEHHPQQMDSSATLSNAAMLERMQDNLKVMQGQLQRAASAKTDEERQQAMNEHMQTMRDNMGMAATMTGCPMMQGGMGMMGGMGGKGGMMGMMGGGAMSQDMGSRMHNMEQRMDMMQMMMERMSGGGAGGAPMQKPN